jgi:hypothetical protein
VFRGKLSVKRFTSIYEHLAYAGVKAKAIVVERDVEKQCISCHRSHERDVQRCRLAASVIGKLDTFLGYAGMRAFRKDLASLFPCQRDVAEGWRTQTLGTRNPTNL